MEILIRRLNETSKLPVYGQGAEPGIELYISEGVTIDPGSKVTVGTGVAMAMPVGYVGLVRSHLSMVIDEPIKVTTDVIDTGHREEIRIELTNAGTEAKVFVAGDIVAQILVQQAHRANLIEAEELAGEE